MPTTLVLPPQAGGAPPVEVRVEFHKFVLGPELPATFEVRAMEDPSERQAITCRVVSRGGVVPYEALIVGVHADGLCFDAQKTDATEVPIDPFPLYKQVHRTASSIE